MSFVQKMQQVPCSKVELHISCKNLLDKDITSKSDPCACIMAETNGHWYELGRTENMKNCLNPDFVKTFEMDYMFEEVQKLRIEVFDIDNVTPQLDDDDYLGGIECTLGQVVSSSPFTRSLLLRNKSKAGHGTITLRSEELANLNDLLTLSFKATKLDKKDFLGKSDPYLELSRQLSDGTWSAVHRTEVIKNNLNPTWRPFTIKAQKLCAGNYESPVKIAVYDYDDGDAHDFIGEFETSIPAMKEAESHEVQWPCINPKKKAKKKGYKDSGIIYLTKCQMTKEHSFLDFIFGGLQLNFTVGIDFTASNGQPSQSTSLHYMNPYQPNEYIKAIQSVGAVIQDYDSDQMFPALGFGAKVPPSHQVSHEFALNFNPQNPFCAGIAGVLQAYQVCVPQIQLYGPTNFSPIIQHVSKFAAAAQRERGPSNYFVLLIITDGVISDMDNTLASIVQASILPMSLIIVGVGGADFTAMDILDGDNGVLRDRRGSVARRDIVQFVPFRDFARASAAELAKHVLYEIPGQVQGYYKMVNIAPNPRQETPPGGQQAPPPGGAPVAPPRTVPPGGQYAAPQAAPPGGQYPPAGAPPGGQYRQPGAPPGGQYPPAGAPPGGQYRQPGAPPGGQYPPAGAPSAPPPGGQYPPAGGAPMGMPQLQKPY